MTASVSNAAAVVRCNATVDLLDVGTGTPSLKFYTGTIPDRLDITATGTLLATLAMDGTAAFGNAVDVPGSNLARATANTITGAAAVADGLAGYYRALDRDDLEVYQDTVGEASEAIVFDSADFTAGAMVNVTALTFDEPEAA